MKEIFVFKLFRRFLRKLKLLSVIYNPLNPKCEPFIIVTASDYTHFQSLIQFLNSVQKFNLIKETFIYDLGLKQKEIRFIKEHYPFAELRHFKYSHYPKYFDIKVNSGEYAWKPVIVFDVLSEFKCCVCWMDAGNVLIDSLKVLRKIINAYGFYSPQSSGTIQDWTHPQTLRYLNVLPGMLNLKNLNGACVCVSYKNKEAFKLIEKWRNCALVKSCIAPPGSSKKKSPPRSGSVICSFLPISAQQENPHQIIRFFNTSGHRQYKQIKFFANYC